MSTSQPNVQKIEVLDLVTKISISYVSMCAAAKSLNIHQPIISNYILRSQIKPYKGRYIFKKL